MIEENKGLFLNETIETTILIILSAFTAFIQIFYANGFLNIFQNIIVVGLTLLAVWILYLNRYYFASYFILGLICYFSGLYQLILATFSLNFQGNFTINFNWYLIVQAIASLYIMFMIYMYFTKDGFKFNKENFYLDPLMLTFTIFIFFLYGVTGFIYIAFIEFLAINYKKESSLALMLSKTISPIFLIFMIIVNLGIKALTIYNIIMACMAIGVIVLIVLKAISLYKIKEE